MATTEERVHETGVVGEDLILQCNVTQLSKESLDWFLHREGVRDLRLCYAGEINEAMRQKYALETERYGYELIIRDLTVADAGTYICKWSKNDEIRFLVDVRSESTILPTTEEPAAGSLSLYVLLLIGVLLQIYYA